MEAKSIDLDLHQRKCKLVVKFRLMTSDLKLLLRSPTLEAKTKRKCVNEEQDERSEGSELDWTPE